MIEIINLKKRFRIPKRAQGLTSSQHKGSHFYALNGLNLEVPIGEVHGVVGANGSGKSTLMRMVAGLVHPSNGAVRINGMKLGAIRKKSYNVGYLPASGKLYSHLTVQQNVEFFAKLSGMSPYQASKSSRLMLDELGCDHFRMLRPDDLSFGMYQKARLARLLVTNPQALLLDEPSTGVDIVGSSQLNDLIKNLAETGIPILLATHNTSEIEAYCTKLTILREGRSAFTGTLNELHSTSGESDLHKAIYRYIEEDHQ